MAAGAWRRRLVPALAVLLGAVGAAAGAWQVFHIAPLERGLNTPFSDHGGEVMFRVGAGSTARTVAERLEVSGIVADRRVFLHGVRAAGVEGALQAGLYRFEDPLAPAEVVRRIADGVVATLRFMLPEGLDLDQTVEALAEQEVGEADRLRESFRDPRLTRELMGDLDPEARTLEGYLFPSTYRIPPETSAEGVARLLAGQFAALWTPARRGAAGRRERSIREIATLASIVEKETGDPAERPRVASVFWNRLRIGMPLQTDPTVLYAMRRAGNHSNNIRRDDLAMESPWNTYRVHGLPPGPIASFGEAALDAVLAPEETNFLYFVSRNDGTHVFSRSLREHNRAVRRWQPRITR